MVERVSCVCGGSVNRAFLTLLSELENLVGNLVVGLFAIGFFEKLFLEFMQSVVYAKRYFAERFGSPLRCSAGAVPGRWTYRQGAC